MKQFKALLVKDFFVNRKGLLVPVWIVAGAYLLALAGMVVAIAKGNTEISLGGIPVQFLNNESMHQALSFGMQVGLFFSFIGIIVAISSLITSSMLLNQDVKHKCELFHRSQPVNVWSLTASRYLVGIGGMIMLSFLLGLINFLVANILVSIITPLRIDWWLATNGFLLSWLHISIVLLVSGSICFVLSSVFRDNALGKGILGLAGIEIVIRALNSIYRVGFPSLFENTQKLIMSGVNSFNETASALKYGSISINPQDSAYLNALAAKGPEAIAKAFGLPEHFLNIMWSTLFTWDIGFKLLFCIAMYILATCFYQRREVQF
jgi:hypothetical protein